MNAVQTEIYTDFHGLANLKAQAGRDQSAALEQTAKQFEAVFLKMMLKSMRDAVPESGLINDDKSKFYQAMYDDQLALSMSQSHGLGLADMIVQQLGGRIAGLDNSAADEKATGLTLADYRLAALPKHAVDHSDFNDALGVQSLTRPKPDSEVIRTPEEFVQTLWPHAQAAADELGVDPQVLLAQSALETGWGQHMIRNSDGLNSFNLFGIKAHRDWEGDYVTVPTLEYHEQRAVRRHEPFRVYTDYAESFQDYVRFLKSNPRYQATLDAAPSADNYLRELQDAGYATDPAYADKIKSIMNRNDFTVWVDALKAGASEPITA